MIRLRIVTMINTNSFAVSMQKRKDKFMVLNSIWAMLRNMIIGKAKVVRYELRSFAFAEIILNRQDR